MPHPVALITGAAHRLGAHTAETLHARGWNVVIHYRNREPQARDLVAKLNQIRPESAICHRADLGNMTQLRQLAQRACMHWGQLNALINNASVFYPSPTEIASEQDWETILGANLKAPFFLLQQCLPALKATSGSVINMIDIYSEKPLKDHPLYCASKAGLAALTRSWAKDLAPDVRVNGVSPGAILWPEAGSEVDESYQQSILDKPLWLVPGPLRILPVQ